jgi:hypothetical protein
LYVFNDFAEDFDGAGHQATRQYFKEHPGLLQRIKDKLEGGKLRWKLRKMKHRLLFVPEKRTEYAALYKDYCLNVIHSILDRTGLDNPYDSIQTLKHSKPVRHEKNEGVTVYIVHNLAKEYIGTWKKGSRSWRKSATGKPSGCILKIRRHSGTFCYNYAEQILLFGSNFFVTKKRGRPPSAIRFSIEMLKQLYLRFV